MRRFYVPLLIGLLLGGCVTRRSHKEEFVSLPPPPIVPKCTVHEGTNQWHNLDYGLPGMVDILLDRNGFATGYSISKAQPLWVSYRLTGPKVVARVAKRMPFRMDLLAPPNVTPDDYTGAGYDRGHIAPAADMAWSHDSMRNSFYMSNMSPQVGMFNRGIWRLLEEWVRQQALDKGSLIVLSGPIFSTNGTYQVIGKSSSIEVPIGYWKVIMEEDTRQSIGFILENQEYKGHDLLRFVRDVDTVEEVTGLDFFSKFSPGYQANIESSVTTNYWFRMEKRK